MDKLKPYRITPLMGAGLLVASVVAGLGLELYPWSTITILALFFAGVFLNFVRRESEK